MNILKSLNVVKDKTIEALIREAYVVNFYEEYVSIQLRYNSIIAKILSGQKVSIDANGYTCFEFFIDIEASNGEHKSIRINAILTD